MWLTLTTPDHNSGGQFIFEIYDATYNSTTQVWDITWPTLGYSASKVIGTQSTLDWPDDGDTLFVGFNFLGRRGATGYAISGGGQGTDGRQGRQGRQGPTGTVDSQGRHGDQGPQGNQGYDGRQGTLGLKGSAGVVTNQGTQGFQGFNGTGTPELYTGTTGPNLNITTDGAIWLKIP